MKDERLNSLDYLSEFERLVVSLFYSKSTIFRAILVEFVILVQLLNSCSRFYLYLCERKKLRIMN